jgi:hypothetical protein
MAPRCRVFATVRKKRTGAPIVGPVMIVASSRANSTLKAAMLSGALDVVDNASIAIASRMKMEALTPLKKLLPSD